MENRKGRALPVLPRKGVKVHNLGLSVKAELYFCADGGVGDAGSLPSPLRNTTVLRDMHLQKTLTTRPCDTDHKGCDFW